jgi:hypothetical protein
LCSVGQVAERCRAHLSYRMPPSHRRSTSKRSWNRRVATIALLFSSGNSRIDYTILRLEPYPQGGGTRPTEVINRFEDERTFDGEIGVDSRCSRPRTRFRVAPGCDYWFVKPDGEAAAIDQGAIVLRPIADPISENEGGFGHDPSITVGVTSVNYATKSTTPTNSSRKLLFVMVSETGKAQRQTLDDAGGVAAQQAGFFNVSHRAAQERVLER